MKQIIHTFKQFIALVNVRCLEIRLHDQNEAIAHVNDFDTRVQISRSRRITQRELVNARMRYTEMLPPGDRRTYKIA